MTQQCRGDIPEAYITLLLGATIMLLVMIILLVGATLMLMVMMVMILLCHSVGGGVQFQRVALGKSA